MGRAEAEGQLVVASMRPLHPRVPHREHTAAARGLQRQGLLLGKAQQDGKEGAGTSVDAALWPGPAQDWSLLGQPGVEVPLGGPGPKTWPWEPPPLTPCKVQAHT